MRKKRDRKKKEGKSADRLADTQNRLLSVIYLPQSSAPSHQSVLRCSFLSSTEGVESEAWSLNWERRTNQLQDEGRGRDALLWWVGQRKALPIRHTMCKKREIDYKEVKVELKGGITHSLN